MLTDEALPSHSTMAELAELAGDHDTREGKQRCAAWGTMCSEVEGKTGIGFKANTAEETAAELASYICELHVLHVQL
eukprot:SAG31_NODE_15136_length_768_cov_1.772795_1_plen_77_part_00